MTDDLHANTVRGAVTGQAVLARDITAGAIILHPAQHAAAVRRPRQLPLPGRAWVNREPELATLDRLAGRPGPTRVLVTGMGGVGKTALASQWLFRRRADHPDGTLYIDLGGWSGRLPLSPEQVLAGWLRALGVPGDDVPHDLAELAALYRTVTADLSLLILADNAVDAAQVHPLLPASPTCVIVVTSRRRLPGLALTGFSYLELDCLSIQDSATLLVELLPDRETTPEDVEALAVRCRGLPLALSIAGGYLTVHTRHSPARLLDRLDTNPRQQLEMSLDDMSIQSVLDASDQELDPACARLYRLCALHPGAEFTIGPMAAAWERPETDTEYGLSNLVNASLVIEPTQGRYQLHDLVRDHARSLAERHDQPDDRDAALRRIIQWYLHRTAEADLALSAFAPRFSPIFQVITTPPRKPEPTAAAVRAWFEAERSTILACQQLAAERGWYELVYQFAEAVWNALRPSYSAGELLQTQQLGADAARRCHIASGPPSANRAERDAATARQLEALCLIRVAFAESNRGQHDNAIATATAALELATALSDDWTRSAALSTRARAHLAGDNPRAALGDLQCSLEIAETNGDTRSIALRHRRIGQVLTHPDVADYPHAIEHLRHAATLMRSIGDNLGHARVILYLADALVHADQACTALTELEQVVDAVRAHGSPGYTADLCTAMGSVHARLGRVTQARRSYSEALQLYEAAGPGATRQRDAVAALRSALPATDRPQRPDNPGG